MKSKYFLGLLIVLYSIGCSSQKMATFGTKSKKSFKLFGEAMKEYQIQNYSNSIKLLTKSIKGDNNYIDAFDLRAQNYVALENYELAVADFKTVLLLEPNRLPTMMDLANLYFENQKYKESKILLDKIIRFTRKGDLNAKAKRLYRSADFAEYAVKNPVPFVPENLGASVNTPHEEYFPCLSLDEKTFYFTRRDGSLPIFRQNEDLFLSENKDEKWQKASNLGKPINTDKNEAAFNLTPDGKYLLFTACSRAGGMGTCDIWITKNIGGKWVEPKNLGAPVNSKYWETQPSLSPNGQTLFFVSNRPGGYGGTDIWYSEKTGNKWGKPKNMGPTINTPKDEQFPFIHHDGKTLYYSSAGLPGMGKSDIFITRWVDKGWSNPINLGYPINTIEDDWNFTVNRKGDKAYISSDREGGYGGLDIYSFDLYEQARPTKTGFVKGYVYDAETKKPLAASVDLLDLESNSLVSSTESDVKNGTFLLPLPTNKKYAFEASAKGYLFYSDHFELVAADAEKPYTLKIGLKKIKINVPVIVKNIFFDVNKSEIKQESAAELEVMYQFLLENSTLNIEIGGHTDITGTQERNLVLSSNRAKAVYDYLVNKGIPAARLAYKGYGSSQPIATNDTEEGKYQNRRTEFRIISL